MDRQDWRADRFRRIGNLNGAGFRIISPIPAKNISETPFTNCRKSVKITDGLDEPPAQAYDHSDGALRRQAIAHNNAVHDDCKKMEEFP